MGSASGFSPLPPTVPRPIQLGAHLPCQEAHSIRIPGAWGRVPGIPCPLSPSVAAPLPSALCPLHGLVPDPTLLSRLFSEPDLPWSRASPPGRQKRKITVYFLGGSCLLDPPTQEPRLPGLPPLPTHLNRAFKFSGSSVRPAYPGFMVMKRPTVGMRLIISPRKLNVFFLARIASWTHFT